MIYTPSTAQSIMTQHLLSHPVAALFCGMGIGKTVATLDAVDHLAVDFKITGALIVAPLRVATMTWPAEVEKWDHLSWMKIANLRTPEGRKALHDGTAQLYVINFEMLQQLAGWIGNAKELPFQVAIIDELSKAKDRTSKRIKAIRPIIWKHCPRRWGLTGTPTPNSEMDLYAQILLLDGGKRLGKSWTRFRDQYFKQADYMGYKWEPRDDTPAKIKEVLSDITISMRTSDWCDLPDTREVDVDIELPKTAVDAYKEMEREMIVAFQSGSEAVALNAAVKVKKMLQLTSGAIYVDGTDKYEVVHTAKYDAVEKTLKAIRTPHKGVLVVYQYRHELFELKRRIKGAVDFKEANLEDWNSGKIAVMLCHPLSMSHGLNLQAGGKDIIWITPTYSSEEYDQLNARLYRRGQEDVTTVYRVLAKNTIDWVVAEILRNKGQRQDDLLKSLRRYYDKN